MLEGGEGEGGVTVVATTGAVGSGAVLWPFEQPPPSGAGAY